MIDENKRKNSFGSTFLALCEQWLKSLGYKSIHAEASPKALGFYKKYGYVEMPFNDPDNYPSDQSDTPVGKIL